MVFPIPSCCQPNSAGPNSIEKACQLLLRRGEDDLDVHVFPQSLQFHEIRQLVGAAFGGNTVQEGNNIIMYFLKPLHLEGDENTKERQDMAGFCLGFSAYENLQKNGLAFGLRDKNSNDLKAVVVFREYQPKKENRKPGVLTKIADFITLMRAYFQMKYKDPMGLPAILNDPSKQKDFKESSEAVQPMQEMLHGWHCKYAPQEPHWYVALVATDPDCHGKGYGKRLMNTLHEAADECGMACYLETHETERGFYERMGYNVTKQISMHFACERLGELESPGFLMTRPRR